MAHLLAHNLFLRSELLAPDDLRYSLEVPISCDENQIVFEHQRCDPKVVVRNRGTGSPELNENPRVMFRCFPARQQHTHSGLGEQSVQQILMP